MPGCSQGTNFRPLWLFKLKKKTQNVEGVVQEHQVKVFSTLYWQMMQNQYAPKKDLN